MIWSTFFFFHVFVALMNQSINERRMEEMTTESDESEEGEATTEIS